MPTAAELRVNVDSLRRIRAPRRDSIYNGADDDGSGSMAVLEIAEALANAPVKPARSVLFVWHTGEEDGLLGSAYFTAHPTVPRDSIIAQINIDMIGRGTAQDVIGGGPRELGDVIEAVNARQQRPFKFDLSWDAPDHPEQIYGRSDHANYARVGIPVAFFFTGLHADYHQITDAPQYLDYPHYTRITQYLHDVVGCRLGAPRCARACSGGFGFQLTDESPQVRRATQQHRRRGRHLLTRGALLLR
jgi:hypothetical protein